MKDNDIIKALECLFGCVDCRECPYSQMYEFSICQQQVAKDTLDLINRQQAENENLKVENQSLRSAANSLKMHYEEAQAEIERLQQIVEDKGGLILIDNAKPEAYKECLAKVKNYIKTHCNPYGKPDFDYDTSIKILNFIDKLAKETVGDDNA